MAHASHRPAGIRAERERISSVVCCGVNMVIPWNEDRDRVACHVVDVDTIGRYRRIVDHMPQGLLAWIQ